MKKPPRLQKGQEHLTSKQEAYAHQFVQERITAMLATTAIDEYQALDHLCLAYRVAGLEMPAVRWFDSPIAFIQYCVANSVRYNEADNVGIKMLAGVRNSISNSVRDSVRGSILARAGWRVSNSILTNVKANILASMENNINSIWAGIKGNREYLWEHMNAWILASVGAYSNEDTLAFSRFFHEVFEENELIHLAFFNEMVSGYLLGSKQARLVHKPIHLQRDIEGRLHSEDRMCLQYRDGWGFYAWHGVRVPEKVILHPERLTKQDWLDERNLEVRRAMQERLGNERFVQLLGGICIDTGTRGSLIRIDLRNDPERVAHYVKVKDASTPREYYLRVPPFITRADEAVAWTFGLNLRAYHPTQET